MKTALAYLMTGSCVFTVCPLAFGLGIRVPDQDAFAVARGNAFAATADNPSAIFYNPAGITQLEGLQSRLGAYIISLNSDYTSPAGHSVDTDDAIQAVPHIFTVYSPENSRFSFGFGSYSPFGLSLEWPDDSGFRRLAKEGRIMYLAFNPVVAVEVAKGFSLAAGPTINWAEATLKRGVVVPGDELKFKGDDWAPGFNLGLRWQPHAQHVFGVNYLSWTDMDFKGTTSLSLVMPVARSSSEAASTEFNFPQHVVLGYSFRPTEAWNLEFNADWTDWDTLNTVLLEQETSASIALPFNWESSWMFQWGATRYFDKGWAVSGGYIFSQNSVPDEWFSPSIPDSDRHLLSVGVGRRSSRVSWDATYQFGYGPTRTVVGSPALPNPIVPGTVDSADGDYEFTSHAVTLSLGISF